MAIDRHEHQAPGAAGEHEPRLGKALPQGAAAHRRGGLPGQREGGRRGVDRRERVTALTQRPAALAVADLGRGGGVLEQARLRHGPGDLGQAVGQEPTVHRPIVPALGEFVAELELELAPEPLIDQVMPVRVDLSSGDRVRAREHRVLVLRPRRFALTQRRPVRLAVADAFHRRSGREPVRLAQQLPRARPLRLAEGNRRAQGDVPDRVPGPGGAGAAVIDQLGDRARAAELLNPLVPPAAQQMRQQLPGVLQAPGAAARLDDHATSSMPRARRSSARRARRLACSSRIAMTSSGTGRPALAAVFMCLAS